MTGSSVEDEILAMKLDNTQFEHAASTSLSTLDKLKNALSFSGGSLGKDLGNLSSSVRGFNMNPLVDSASEVGKAFSYMSVVAISAIATIASEATQAGLGLVKSLTISPIASGFAEYGTQLNSIQTIMANTGLEGQKGLDKVNAALDQLNHYSDKTIYNFTEMARNIGTFSAAGVDLDTSTAAIKGIANVAAVSGSNSQQASTAMYQLSQALASGSVKLMDWNSVVNAGMGGKVFKDSIMETARAHGVAIDDMIKQDGSFRDTLQRGWFSADILTETLSKFTGDLTKKQLLSMNYTAKQADEIIKMGKVAQDAATKVKTLPQLIDTLKEAVGSGWTKSFALIIGDFNQARTTFTQLSDYFGGIVGSSAKARNQMISDWADLKGRAVLIKAIRHAWESLMSILGPIHDAFREIFPATTGKQLFEITQAVNHFFKALVLSKDAQENLKNTFAGFFAVLHIGFTIIAGIAHVLGTLIGLFLKGQGSTLALTGGIGQLLVALDAFLTRGKYVENFFDGLAIAVVAILGPLVDIKNALVEAFIGLVSGDPAGFFAGIGNAVSSLLGLVDSLSAAFASVVNTISDALGGVGHIQGLDLSSMFGGSSADGAKKGIDGIKDSLSGVADTSTGIKHIWDTIIDAFTRAGSGAIGGLESGAQGVVDAWNKVLSVVHAIGDFLQPLTDQFGTVFGALQSAFANVGSGLDFSDVLDAINTGLFLAIFIQINRFSNALTGVANSAQGVLKQVTSNLKSMQAEVRANIILQIAVSLALLAGAIFLLSKTDPKHLAASLGAISIMLIELVAALKLLEKNIGKGESLKLIAVAAAMSIMAVALAAMAGAVYLFSLMDPAAMAQGLIGVTAALTVLTAAAALMSKSGAGANMIGAAAGLLIMSVALVALLGAIEIYSRIDPATLASGLIKVGASILVLAVAMNLMKTGVGGAAAMFIVAAGLVVLSKALNSFAAMSKGDIAKALITMAASLAILVVAMNAMTGGLLGAAALFIMVSALSVLVPVLIALGTMSWETIGKGLLVLVGSMLAMGLAAAAIAPVVIVLVGFAAAIALIGAGVFLAGTGVLFLASGLALLAHNGSAGFDVLIDGIFKFLDALPEMVMAFGDTIGAIANVIGEKAPELVVAFAALIASMLDAATRNIPKFGQFISALIRAGLKVLVSYYSDLANAGLDLLLNLISAFDTHIDRIVTAATNLIIHFVQALARNGVKLANAGLQALIDFLNGLADAINTHSHEINAAGGRVALALINGIGDGIRGAVSFIKDAIVALVTSAANAVKGTVGGIIKSVVPGQRALEALTGSFAKLVGGTDQVNDALSNIQGQIKDTLQKSGEDVDKWSEKLKHLKNSGGTPKEIKNAQDMLKAAKDLQKDAEKANDAYKHNMKARGDQLKQLAKDYDETLKKVDDAQKAFDDADQAQKDFKAGILDAFGTVPDIQAGQSLASYMRQVAQQQAKVERFKATLAALQAAGLDPAQIQQFLDEGLDAQKVMDQLLAGGPAAIDAFEKSTAGLTSAAQGLADMTSAMLGKDAAVTAAKLVLDGLTTGLSDPKSLANIEAAMGNIAKFMMKAIRKELAVKSPSQKAAEVGYFFVKGLVNQIDGMHRDVERSASALGATALDTLQTTLSRVGDGVNSRISMSPVITPILDLSQLTRDANQISSLMSANPIAASISYAQASDISASRRMAEYDDDSTSTEPPVRDITFEQNYYSPKTPDPITVYRNNKSSIALAKGVLYD